MEDFKHKCFVCGSPVTPETSELNSDVGLPVCKNCKDTPQEKEKAEEYLDSLADGLVCGCI